MSEGANDSLRIEIPKGTYIPQFERWSPERIEGAGSDSRSEDQHFSDQALSSEQLAATNPDLVRTSQLRQPTVRSFVLGVCAGVVCLALGYSVYQRGRNPSTTADPLWNLLFEKSRPTLLVLGDAGLNMYSNLAQRQVDVSGIRNPADICWDPAARTPPGFTWAPFAVRAYTTLADAKLLARLMRISTVSTDQMQVRSARSLEMADLQNSNAILSGSPNYDPWISLFERNSDFRMEYEGRENAIYLLNRAPRTGELGTYKWSQSDPTRDGLRFY